MISDTQIDINTLVFVIDNYEQNVENKDLFNQVL